MKRAVRIAIGIPAMSLTLGVITGTLASVTGASVGGGAVAGWDAFIFVGSLVGGSALVFGISAVLFVKAMDWMLDA